MTLQQKVFIVKNYYQITDMFEVRKAFIRSYSMHVEEGILEVFFKIVTQFELTGSVIPAVYYETPSRDTVAAEKSSPQAVTPSKKARKLGKKREERLILTIPDSEEEDESGQPQPHTPDEDHLQPVSDRTDRVDWNLDLAADQQDANTVLYAASPDPAEAHHEGDDKVADREEEPETEDNIDEIEDPDYIESESEQEVEVVAPKNKRTKRSPTKKPRVECPICQKTYTKEFLRSHMTKHDREGRTYVCSQCDATFDKYDGLRVHLEGHIPANKYTFKCPTCRGKFVSEEKLNLHQKVHTKPKQYICEHCGMFFATPDAMRVHTRTHTGEKPLKCSKCEASFAFYGGLKAHMKKHDGGSYKCNCCEKTFVYKVERNVRIMVFGCNRGNTLQLNVYLIFIAAPKGTHWIKAVHLSRLQSKLCDGCQSAESLEDTAQGRTISGGDPSPELQD